MVLHSALSLGCMIGVVFADADSAFQLYATIYKALIKIPIAL